MKFFLFILSISCLFAAPVFAAESASSPPAEESLGVAAGNAVNQLKVQAGETYQAAQERAEALQKDLDASHQEMLKAFEKFNEESQRTLAEMQASLNEMLKKIDTEVKRFQETVGQGGQAPVSSKGSPASPAGKSS